MWPSTYSLIALTLKLLNLKSLLLDNLKQLEKCKKAYIERKTSLKFFSLFKVWYQLSVELNLH